MTFNEKLASIAAVVNELLRELLLEEPEGAYSSSRLGEAMRYAALDGGKRFRPFLVIETASLFDVPMAKALYAAAAVECIHCYSLVHDDLPSMDDDDLRRGRPTVHIAFDEATAILAGDGLQALAFEILADPNCHPDGAVRAELVASLARAAGWHGMAGGQDMDLQAPDQTLSASQIQTLQKMKTGALIEWSCSAGALLGGASEEQRQALVTYANAIGLGFQIADDLLDYEGDATVVGKDVGKDAGAGKATLVAALGVDAARAKLRELEETAIESVSPFGKRADTLKEAAQFVTRRER